MPKIVHSLVGTSLVACRWPWPSPLFWGAVLCLDAAVRAPQVLLASFSSPVRSKSVPGRFPGLDCRDLCVLDGNRCYQGLGWFGGLITCVVDCKHT